LPIKINFGVKGEISYLYNARGGKVRKIVVDKVTNIITTTDYLSGFQYLNTILQFFPHAEGYVHYTKPLQVEGLGAFNYVFNYTDHLGNVRISFAEDPQQGNVLKILEENHYYPFGMKHENYNVGKLNFKEFPDTGVELVPMPAVANSSYNYKYNGKELQEELGLNMYDYGARNYDPSIGRWMNIDPLAEKYPNMSPYIYCANNPLYFIDPNGLEITAIDGGYSFTGDDAKEAFLYIRNNIANKDLKIKKRSEWGARNPDSSKGLKKISAKNLAVYYNSVVIHHTGNRTNSPTPNEVQNKQMDEKDYADVAYNYLIGQDGTIYEGRDLNKQQAHVAGEHAGLIGIALLSDLDSENKGLSDVELKIEEVLGDGKVTAAMTNSLYNLTTKLNQEYGISYFGGHKEFHQALNPKSFGNADSRYCPGNLGMNLVNEIRKSLKMRSPSQMTTLEKKIKP
jgi:RHS repeat-associated protein